jgi:hypothetical protein
VNRQNSGAAAAAPISDWMTSVAHATVSDTRVGAGDRIGVVVPAAAGSAAALTMKRHPSGR